MCVREAVAIRAVALALHGVDGASRAGGEEAEETFLALVHAPCPESLGIVRQCCADKRAVTARATANTDPGAGRPLTARARSPCCVGLKTRTRTVNGMANYEAGVTVVVGVVVAVIVVVVAIAAMAMIMVMADVMMMGIVIGSDNTSSADSSRSNKGIASRLGVESSNRRGY